MNHPGIVVDESRQSPDHPRRLPLVYGRTLSFTETGMSLLPGPSRASLDVDVDGARLFTAKGPEHIGFGDQFRVRRHPYHLDPADELLVDVRAIGTCIAFNCFHAGEADVRWRGFAVADPERLPLDVRTGRDEVRYAPSTTGMPLEHLIAATEAQGARMDAGVALALAMPLLTAAIDRARVTALDVVATWEGGAVLSVRSYRRRPRDEPIAHAVARAVTTFWRLSGREPADAIVDAHVEEMRAMKQAPPAEVASVVKALFPDAWAVERAVREQAGMLDVDAFLA